MAGAVTFLVAGGYRSAWRLAWEYRLRPGANAKPVVIFGAGNGAQQVIDALLADPDTPYAPKALLDDAPEKKNFRIRHLRVSGTRSDLARVAAKCGASSVIIAIPSAGSELIADLTDLAVDAGLEALVLPPVSQLFTPAIGIEDIRPVTEADLLGRRVIDTDMDSVADYLQGKRVLVTGAGGSIGSELCRQITRFEPSCLVMLDRDESGLHQVQLSIEGRALLDTRSLVVCDIRDTDALAAAFAEHRPEVVFHAAALKHQPLLEMWPAEAFKTNVLGTRNVLDAARRVGVIRFVNISTDKAADPSSVLGYTKRLAERVTASVACDGGTGTYLSVRFGNVLGSRGSVLTAFRAQVKAGGPITVTHAEVTRFSMTVEEAVQLVVQAGAIGRNGEALVLDMGEPVRIADVAERLAGESKDPIDIVYTGLRPGEKLHEVLFGTGEVDHRPVHPLVSHVPVPPIGCDAFDQMDMGGGAARVTERLRVLCGVGERVERVEALDAMVMAACAGDQTGHPAVRVVP